MNFNWKENLLWFWSWGIDLNNAFRLIGVVGYRRYNSCDEWRDNEIKKGNTIGSKICYCSRVEEVIFNLIQKPLLRFRHQNNFQR